MADEHTRAMRDFHVQLEECTIEAYCGRPYVLLSKFKKWLKDSRYEPYNISQASRLHAAAYRHRTQPAHLISAEQICDDGCLLLFSILLEMNRGELIHKIWNYSKSDKHLPIDLYALLVIFEELEIPQHKDVAYEFNRLQWKYCSAVLEFNTGRQYPENRVMPFSRRAKINDKGGTAQLWQIEVLEEFVGPKLRKKVEDSKFELDDGLGPRYEFALKAFEDGNKRLFQNERDAFLALLGNRAMVQYLGWYGHKERITDDDNEQEGLPTNPCIITPTGQEVAIKATHNIILEFGESDLDEYFVDNQPPAFQPEVEAFWAGLIEVADAIKSIHHLETNNAGRVQQFSGWHADIKPDNILIVHGKFKLADPGFVHFVKKTDTDPKEVLSGGTETFGAPERHDGWEDSPSKVDQSIDTWSLGCVFSIAATWVVLGYQGIHQFNKLREKAISKIIKEEADLADDQKTRPSLSKGDSFHDSIRVLTAVTEWHKFLRDALRGTDTVTKRILDLVDSGMLLQEPGARIQATDLCNVLRTIIQQGKSEPRISVPTHIQKLLREVEEEAPLPLNSQHAASASTFTSTPTPLTLLPPTIAEVRKSKFLNPPLQKTAHRSQVLNSILISGNSSAILDKSSWKSNEAGPSAKPSLGAPSQAPHSPPLNPAYVNQDPRVSQRDSLHHSVSDSSVGTSPHRPKAPRRASTIPYRTVFQAREEIELRMRRKMKDPLLSKYFDNRDIKFLVDNAGTMADFWYEATYLLETLIKKARGQDENGMDLFFTSGKVKVEGREAKEKGKFSLVSLKEDPFLAAMNHQDAKPTEGHHTDITKSLGEVFAKFLKNAKNEIRTNREVRNLTLIVLTDGRWEGTRDKEEVKRGIVRFAKALTHLLGDFKKRPVSIEFVQFGDDPDASHRLWSLDNELKFDGIPDIIDTEHSRGNVNKMLLGSFNPEIDDDTTIMYTPKQIQGPFDGFEDISGPSRAPTYTTSAQGSRVSTFAAVPRTQTNERYVVGLDSHGGSHDGRDIFGLKRTVSKKREREGHRT